MTSAQSLLQQLGELATALGPAVRPPGSEAGLAALTDTTRRMFGAAACSLARLSDDEEELVYVAASGEGAATVVGMRISSSAGLAGWAVQSGQPIAIADLTQDKRFDRQIAERTGYVPDAMIVVPVVTDRRTYGVISVLDRDAGRADARNDLQLLDSVARQAAAVLEVEAAFSDLGRVLLAAMAVAAGSDSDLADAVKAVTLSGRDADLAELAATFATLAAQGAAERRLALAILRETASYARKKAPRTG